MGAIRPRWGALRGHPAAIEPDVLRIAPDAVQGRYADALSELDQNNKVANQLSLKNYSKQTLVTPDVSGLTNANMLQAAYDYGVRYLVSDISRAGYNNPTPNAGIYNPLQPGILMIPRHPVNLYFNVVTPQQWLAEDNCLYPAGAYGHVNTYQQLLDRESTMLLTYLLNGDIDPLMFHQPNVGAYDGTHSLLGDFMEATFAKYSALVKVPILSPSQQALGQPMANRMAYNASGVTAKMVGTTQIVVSVTQAATVPISGLITSCGGCTAEPYAGQNSTWVKLNAGQSVMLTIQNPVAAPSHD